MRGEQPSVALEEPAPVSSTPTTSPFDRPTEPDRAPAKASPASAPAAVLGAVGDALDLADQGALHRALDHLVRGLDQTLQPGWSCLTASAGVGLESPVIAPSAPEEFRQAEADERARWQVTGRRAVLNHSGAPLGTLTLHAGAGPPPSILELVARTAGHLLASPRAVAALGHDPLTGLATRESLLEGLGSALAATGATTDDVSLLLIDLDDFKVVNTGRGHDVGDAILREMAGRLRKAAGDVTGVTIARIGDDEFAALFSAGSGVDPTDWASAARAALRRPFLYDGRPYELTASLGLAHSEGRQDRDLMASAETALKRAKSGGGDRLVTADHVMGERARRRVELEQTLRRAIEARQLLTYYQPQIATDSGLICGVEALVRWHHPEHGLVHPGAFLSVAEESGLIHEIGAMMLAHACRDGVELRSRAKATAPTMSVNVSALQLADRSFPDLVTATLAETGLAAEALCLEITESITLAESVRAEAGFHRLREIGVRLSIDDFGTGYSSLEYLRELPVDEVKIDRSFVSAMTEARGLRLVEAICGIAHALELDIVAEGVEYDHEVGPLLAYGCDVFQGFKYFKPMPFGDVVKALKKDKPRPMVADVTHP
jgi:diguanylate cyclase (GGDEF)-like protein